MKNNSDSDSDGLWSNIKYKELILHRILDSILATKLFIISNNLLLSVLQLYNLVVFGEGSIMSFDSLSV